MKCLFRYKLDKRVMRRSIILFLVVILSIFLFNYFVGNTYLSAWILGVVMAVVGFVVMSIPRFIKVSRSRFEVQCLLELTIINVEDIVSASRLEKESLKSIIPLFASCGFCGYFGYYIDLRNWNIFRVYASSWENLVVIEDIYEDLYIVNVERPDDFIETVISQRNARRKDIAELSAGEAPVRD